MQQLGDAAYSEENQTRTLSAHRGPPGLDATVWQGPGSAHLPGGHFSICHVATLGAKRGGSTPAEVGTTWGPEAGFRDACYVRVTSDPVPGNVLSLHPKASDRGGVLSTMPFWMVAVLSAAGVVGIVWVLYLLARRWM